MIRFSASVLTLALLTGAVQAQTINVVLNADIRSTNPGVKLPSKVWDNREADALIEKATLVGDEAERGKIFDQLHVTMLADAPLIFLYNQVDTAVVSKRLQGFAPWVASRPRLWEVAVAK